MDERTGTATADSPIGELVDVAAEPSPFLLPKRLALAIGILSCFAFIMIFAVSLSSPWNYVSAYSLSTALIVAVYYKMKTAQEKCLKMLRMHGEFRDLRTPLEYLAEQEPYLISQVLKPNALRKCFFSGFEGLSYRVGSRKRMVPVTPLGFAFEARLIDESDAGFHELQEAASTCAAGEEVDSSSNPGRWVDRSDTEPLRKLRRNVLLSGGWGSVIAASGLAIVFAVQSWWERRWHIGVFLWSGLLIFNLLGLTVRRTGEQWYLVPGGLICRRARIRDSTWSVRVFERRRSLLIMVALHRKTSWLVCVMDEDAVAQLTLTQSEGAMLLRAWLSHHHPPRVEQLGDLS